MALKILYTQNSGQLEDSRKIYILGILKKKKSHSPAEIVKKFAASGSNYTKIGDDRGHPI